MAHYDLCIYITIGSCPVEPLCRWYLSIVHTAICAIPLCRKLYGHTSRFLATFIKVYRESVTCWQCGNSDNCIISVIISRADECRPWKRVAGLLRWQNWCANHEDMCYAFFDNPLLRPPSFLVNLCPTLHYNNTYLDKQTEFIKIERCKTKRYTIKTQLSDGRSFYELSQF